MAGRNARAGAILAGGILILILGAGRAEALGQCGPAPKASAAGGAERTRVVAGGPTQSVLCGDMTVSLAAPVLPAAAPASPASAAETPANPPVADDHLDFRRLGLWLAAALLATAVAMMLLAFVATLRGAPLAVNRDTIRFGGAGHGWEVSPAFAALAAAAVIAAMALALGLQALDFGTAPAKAAAPPAKAPAADKEPR